MKKLNLIALSLTVAVAIMAIAPVVSASNTHQNHWEEWTAISNNLIVREGITPDSKICYNGTLENYGGENLCEGDKPSDAYVKKQSVGSEDYYRYYHKVYVRVTR